MKDLIKAGSIALLMVLAILLYSLLPEDQQVLEKLVRTEFSSEHSEAAQDDDERADQNDEPDAEEHRLRLDAEAQVQSGIQLIAPRAMQLSDEVLAYGQVEDILPLVEMRTRYHRIQAERQLVQTALNTERQTVKRLRQLLTEQTSVSARQLREAESRLAYEQARSNAIQQSIQDIRHESRQAWGETLTSMLFNPDDQRFASLLSGQSVLLRIILPMEASLPDEIREIQVSRGLQRQQSTRAEWVSAAVQTDQINQGESWYFMTPAAHYRTGMRLNAWIRQSSHASSGNFIPTSAVVWYAGKPWTYKRIDGEIFERVSLYNAQTVEGGLFVPEGLQETDEIVISGGQMLLSEEFRWQIPEEDDDDD